MLCGFERITLEPSESRHVVKTLISKVLSLLDGNIVRVVEPGDFDILIGASSTDIRLTQKLTVTDSAGLRTDERLYPDSIASVPRFPIRLECSEDITFHSSKEHALVP